MRILYLTDRLSDRGGADHHLRAVARAFAGHHPVTVASGQGAWPELEHVRVKGLAARGPQRAGLARLPALLAAAEVVHVQNVMNPVAVAMAAATGRAVVTVQDHRVFCPGAGKTTEGGERCGAPMSEALCAERCPGSLRSLGFTRERLAALRGARLVVLSRYMADELAAAGLPGAAVIPPWVPIGEPPEPGEGFLLGGRLVAHKAPLEALAAWQLAGRPQSLAVAGEGRLAGALEAGGARLLGWLAPAALRAALRGARALLFPARWQEPFGILGAEALAEGTPVIVMDAGGVGEWAQEGCVVVERGDIAGMASAIGRLAADPAGAVELGAAGQEWVSRRFEREGLVERLEGVYREVVGLRG